jgi:hypothetical protein
MLAQRARETPEPGPASAARPRTQRSKAERTESEARSEAKPSGGRAAQAMPAPRPVGLAARAVPAPEPVGVVARFPAPGPVLQGLVRRDQGTGVEPREHGIAEGEEFRAVLRGHGVTRRRAQPIRIEVAAILCDAEADVRTGGEAR